MSIFMNLSPMIWHGVNLIRRWRNPEAFPAYHRYFELRLMEEDLKKFLREWKRARKYFQLDKYNLNLD